MILALDNRKQYVSNCVTVRDNQRNAVIAHTLSSGIRVQN